MLGSGIAMWQICCTTSCTIVVSSSVGGVTAVVQHVRRLLRSRCPCSGVWHYAEPCISYGRVARPSNCLSDTRCHCIKTTQARITKSSQTDNPRTSFGFISKVTARNPCKINGRFNLTTPLIPPEFWGYSLWTRLPMLWFLGAKTLN